MISFSIFGKSTIFQNADLYFVAELRQESFDEGNFTAIQIKNYLNNPFPEQVMQMNKTEVSSIVCNYQLCYIIAFHQL